MINDPTTKNGKKYTEILNSINEVGFENTASIYSIADSNKTGGSVGWVDVSSLNKEIKNNISSKLNSIQSKI